MPALLQFRWIGRQAAGPKLELGEEATGPAPPPLSPALFGGDNF